MNEEHDRDHYDPNAYDDYEPDAADTEPLDPNNEVGKASPPKRDESPPGSAVAVRDEQRGATAVMTVDDVLHQAEQIKTLMRRAMQNNHHYGVIPGTDKPTLLKPGAEKLCVMFRLSPEFDEQVKELPDDHREYSFTCTLRNMITGQVWGRGVGTCSTMESKYRYRKADRRCPSCGKPAIIKGKEEYGGGWLCYSKKGGCGAKYDDNDPEIVNQPTGRIENSDIADTYNTVRKMAKKRSHVDATLNALAVSDIFTQDVEDMPDVAGATGGKGGRSSAATADAAAVGDVQRSMQSKYGSKDRPGRCAFCTNSHIMKGDTIVAADMGDGRASWGAEDCYKEWKKQLDLSRNQ